MPVESQEIDEFLDAAQIAAGTARRFPHAFNSTGDLADLIEEILKTETGNVKIPRIGTLHVSSNKKHGQIETPGADIESIR